MCMPKPPAVEKTPIRAAAILPDGGDPAARNVARNRQKLAASAMMFAGRNPTLGAPATTTPLGTSGM